MGRRTAPFERFARRAKPRRRANSLRPSTKNRAPGHAQRVWAGAASQNLGQRRILIKYIKALGVLLLLAASRQGPYFFNIAYEFYPKGWPFGIMLSMKTFLRH